MSIPKILVSELSDAHVGWEINVDDTEMPTAVRSIWVLAVRTRTVGGIRRTELLDGLVRPESMGGTWFDYAPDTSCRVTREFPKVRRVRRRKS